MHPLDDAPGAALDGLHGATGFAIAGTFTVNAIRCS